MTDATGALFLATHAIPVRAPPPRSWPLLSLTPPFSFMPSFHRFLLVDNIAENRFLVSKALLKAFPDAVVSECQDTSTAIALISNDNYNVIIVHRARDLDGTTFIDLVRR